MLLSRRTMSMRATLIAALAAGTTAPAIAQDCRLSVHAWPKVVTPGQSVQIDVRAHFEPIAYAFASAQLDVAATHPAWTFASAGAIVGTNVLGISVGQMHQPQVGPLADPSNPIRIWSGMISPMANGPALVQVAALPQDFWVYPSPLTSSPAPCNAAQGRDWIFVSPLVIGQAAAAPEEGTALATAGDRFVATGESRILIGLLLPAVQKVREAAARMSFDEPPDSLRLRTQLQPEGPQAYPVESISLNFTRIEFEYEVRPTFEPDSVFTFIISRNGRQVAAFKSPAGEARMRIDRLPDTIASRMETDQPAHDPEGRSGHTSMVQACMWDSSVRFVVPGNPVILGDRVEIRSECQNNLKQIGLALHTIESHGAREMSVKPVLNR